LPEQWTKLLINLSNAVSALCGVPTRELILSPGYRRIFAALVEEGVRVLRAASIRPAWLRGLPVSVMPRVLRLPTPLVRVVAARQARIDPDARSSMYQDLAKGRATEVDFLNGEIVALAERIGAAAPFNRRIVELVHDAERAGGGNPQLSAETLWAELDARS
jgi:2-dehydropantoate 2-reductase